MSTGTVPHHVSHSMIMFQRHICVIASFLCCTFPMVLTLSFRPASSHRVCFSHPAEDGHQVMFTHGEHVDVFDDHHLVVVFVEDGVVQHVCPGK